MTKIKSYLAPFHNYIESRGGFKDEIKEPSTASDKAVETLVQMNCPDCNNIILGYVGPKELCKCDTSKERQFLERLVKLWFKDREDRQPYELGNPGIYSTRLKREMEEAKQYLEVE